MVKIEYYHALNINFRYNIKNGYIMILKTLLFHNFHILYCGFLANWYNITSTKDKYLFSLKINYDWRDKA